MNALGVILVLLATLAWPTGLSIGNQIRRWIA